MRDEKEERSKHVQVTLGPTLPKRRRSESGGSWEIQSVAATKVAGPFAQNCTCTCQLASLLTLTTCTTGENLSTRTCILYTRTALYCIHVLHYTVYTYCIILYTRTALYCIHVLHYTVYTYCIILHTRTAGVMYTRTAGVMYTRTAGVRVQYAMVLT